MKSFKVGFLRNGCMCTKGDMCVLSTYNTYHLWDQIMCTSYKMKINNLGIMHNTDHIKNVIILTELV